MDYSSALRAPREQRYTVVPQASKDYNEDESGKITAAVDKIKTLIKVANGSQYTVGAFIEINNEVMRIKEIDSNNLIVQRGVYNTNIVEHAADDRINLVNSVDNELIEFGDTFGFSESRSFFGADGKSFSPKTGTDL